MAPSVQRRIENAKQRFKGRMPFVFQISVVPQCAEGIPTEIKQAAFLLQRQSKLQSTDVTDVHEGTARWTQLLKQESTIYKEGDTFVRKEFSLKLQGLKGRGKSEKPHTFAKMELDVAAYCHCSNPGSRDLIVELRPTGRLHMAIEVTWMQDKVPDMDAMTDLSRMSLGPSLPSSSNMHYQDLSGFDDGIKAVHGTPSKKSVSFGHSLSMPALPNPGTGHTPSRRSLSRAATTAATHGEGFVSRGSHPSVLTDSSATPFSGFPTMPAVEEDLVTPKIPQRTGDRAPLRESLHRKSKSLPASTPATPAAPGDDASEALPATPLSPSSDSNIEKTKSLPASTPATPAAPSGDDSDALPATPLSPSSDSNIEKITQVLASSDEEEGSTTLAASVKRWWTGGKLERRPSGVRSPFAVTGMRSLDLSTSTSIDLESMEKETDIEKLREVCRKALRDSQEQKAANHQLESRIMRLERDKEVLGHTKQGMAERLAVAEDRLARVMREDVMRSLAEAKLQLAQADFDILELQGELHSEKMRNKTLRYTLVNLQDDSLSALNKALIPAAAAHTLPAPMQSSSQEEEVSRSSSVISRGSLDACQEPQHNLPVSLAMRWSSPTSTSLPVPGAMQSWPESHR